MREIFEYMLNFILLKMKNAGSILFFCLILFAKLNSQQLQSEIKTNEMYAGGFKNNSKQIINFAGFNNGIYEKSFTAEINNSEEQNDLKIITEAAFEVFGFKDTNSVEFSGEISKVIDRKK